MEPTAVGHDGGSAAGIETVDDLTRQRGDVSPTQRTSSVLFRAARRAMSHIEVLVGAATTTVTLLVLLVPKPLGLADNADYLRLLCRLPVVPDLAAGRPPLFAFVNLTYHSGIQPGWQCDYNSPAVAPLWLAGKVSARLPGHHALDLRVVAVMYAVAFGVAVGLLVWALPGRWWARLVAGIIALVCLGDFAFTAYFASAYSEPFGLIFLIGTVALLIRAWRARTFRVPALIAVTFTALLLVTTKPQYGPLAPLIAAALLVPPVNHALRRGRWSARAPNIVAAALVVVAGYLSVSSAPSGVSRPDRYDAIFFELLGHSKTPQADLRDLGLPTELARYAGSNWYNEPNARGDPALNDVFHKVGYATLASFYLRHPSRAWSLAERGFQASADPVVHYLGNYAPEAGKAPGATACPLCISSSLTRRFQPNGQWVFLGFWIVSAVIAAVALSRRDRALKVLGGGMALALLSALALLLSALLGEGSYEIVKHLYLADAANMLLLVLTVVTVIELVGAYVSSRRSAPTPLSP
jgi:hypothetical protein